MSNSPDQTPRPDSAARQQIDPNESTYEQACRCPRCKVPGQVVSKSPSTVKQGATLHMIFCRTLDCPWFNTSWVIQVNPDGSVPPPMDHTGRNKQYPKMERPDQAIRDYVDRVEHQATLDTKPGAEIRNPHSR